MYLIIKEQNQKLEQSNLYPETKLRFQNTNCMRGQKIILAKISD